MSSPKLLWLCGHLFRRIELQHHARNLRILRVQPFVMVKRKSPDFSGLFFATWRREPESNRPKRLCRPSDLQQHHSLALIDHTNWPLDLDAAFEKVGGPGVA